MKREEVCSPPKGVFRAEVRAAEAIADRLPKSDMVTVRIDVTLSVVSDYLFVGSGKEGFEVQGIDIGRLHEYARSYYDVERVIRRARASMYKEFFKVYNPYTRRVQPAIPGSTVKGAMRSRIELACRASEQTMGKVLAEFHYDSGPLGQLPKPGMHGWRHARIWCESVVSETRIGSGLPSVVGELFGYSMGSAAVESVPSSAASRVIVSTFYPVDASIECRIKMFDHGERLCVVEKGARFRGEIVVVNASPHDIGLVLYGLGLDKLLCGRDPVILLGYSKYRCRKEILGQGKERTVSFGEVAVNVEAFEPYPGSEKLWNHLLEKLGASSSKASEIAGGFVEEAIKRFPELRKCFDEVERKHKIEPCR